jgi:TetR/AcrR family transcriptional repressor of mexJK operon
MEEVATAAGASKQTVYKHFTDKERLFAEVLLAMTDRVNAIARVADTLAGTQDLEKDLSELARRFLVAIMAPDLLRLRRLLIANAERFPRLGKTWYEQGFEPVLATLATCFMNLADRRLLVLEDPLQAASHFIGMLLWIPVNKAMFTGSEHHVTKAELEREADAAARAFLRAYGATAR